MKKLTRSTSTGESTQPMA